MNTFFDIEEINPADFYAEQDKAREKFYNSEFIFAKGVSRPLDDYRTKLNNNVIVVGTSGCGKTTSFIEPNLLTLAGSYITSDPKGTLLKKNLQELIEAGYEISVINFQNPESSTVHWNPLSNIRSTQDILRIVNMLVYEPHSVCTADPFWDSSSVIYISALIGYMIETNYKPLNFKGLLQLMREGDRFTRRTFKDGERHSTDKASLLSDRFAELHEKNPDSWAYKQFCSVDASPEKTYDCIRVTMASKLAKYTSEEIDELMSSNTIDFEMIAQKKTAVFILQSDCDRSLDGLVNLFFSQAINSLIKYADSCEGQRLPIPVRFFLDDYGATTAIDNLDAIISTIRSRAISVSLILQSEAQLINGKYGSDKTILANCDTYIYMGGNDVETAQAVSIRCNKPLEQILFMPVGHCWVFERGRKPIYTEITERPDLILPEKELIPR